LQLDRRLTNSLYKKEQKNKKRKKTQSAKVGNRKIVRDESNQVKSQPVMLSARETTLIAISDDISKQSAEESDNG